MIEVIERSLDAQRGVDGHRDVGSGLDERHDDLPGRGQPALPMPQSY
jgi:hypothetical protein